MLKLELVQTEKTFNKNIATSEKLRFLSRTNLIKYRNQLDFKKHYEKNNYHPHHWLNYDFLQF